MTQAELRWKPGCTKKVVGIIGGMGPRATLDLFQKIIDLTPAQQDQDHLHVMIDSNPQVPDRTAYLLGQGESPLPWLLESARRLERSGADLLCMPCNTAHHFVEQIRRETAVPLISIIEAAHQAIRERYPQTRRIGLMATRGTFDGRVYHRALCPAGLEIIPLDESLKDQVMDVIYAVKAGRWKEQIGSLASCVNRFRKAGAEILIAGCTEIPLLLPYSQLDLPVVDATRELAENVVRSACAGEGKGAATGGY
jgi:aspartate racemase